MTFTTLAKLAVEVGLNPALFTNWLALQWPGQSWTSIDALQPIASNRESV